jgi:hypothetical protein
MVSHLAPKASVVPCPKEPSASLTYRRRNTMMVEGSDHLLAFVWKDEFYRSGEWMTINIAHAAGVPVNLMIIPQTWSRK